MLLMILVSIYLHLHYQSTSSPPPSSNILLDGRYWDGTGGTAIIGEDY